MLLPTYPPTHLLLQYIHRVGRTGRKGSPGAALLLLNPTEKGFLEHLHELSLKVAIPTSWGQYPRTLGAVPLVPLRRNTNFVRSLPSQQPYCRSHPRFRVLPLLLLTQPLAGFLCNLRNSGKCETGAVPSDPSPKHDPGHHPTTLPLHYPTLPYPTLPCPTPTRIIFQDHGSG